MRLYNVVGDAQPKARSLCAFLSCKKRLQDLVLNLVGDAGSVVFDLDGDSVAISAGADS